MGPVRQLRQPILQRAGQRSDIASRQDRRRILRGLGIRVTRRRGLLGMDYADSGRILQRVRGVGEITESLRPAV